jgi:hypothetical protein
LSVILDEETGYHTAEACGEELRTSPLKSMRKKLNIVICLMPLFEGFQSLRRFQDLKNKKTASMIVVHEAARAECALEVGPCCTTQSVLQQCSWSGLERNS